MFSAVKIVAAAAIVALFGGFLLTGGVGDRQEDVAPPAAVSPSPSAEVAVQLPTEFSGSFTCATYWQDGTTRNVVVGPVEGGNLVRRETRGELGRFDAEMSDPRLQGDWTVYTSSDEYFWPGIDPELPLLMAPGVLHITNEGGSWQMPWGYFDLPGAMHVGEMDGIGYLVGAEGYDGLSAVFRLTSDNWDDDCYCWTGKGITPEAERCVMEMEGLVVEGEAPTPAVPE